MVEMQNEKLYTATTCYLNTCYDNSSDFQVSFQPPDNCPLMS